MGVVDQLGSDGRGEQAVYDYIHAQRNRSAGSQGCDKIVEQLVHSDLSVNEAVCFTLIARHFKRIVAHLVNIATSVVLPLSELDYFDERRAND